MGITKVAIIGGGISGISLLHFLKKRHLSNVEVHLHESNAYLGGNIRTLKQDGFLFETGPNGFLNNSPATLELITDLGLNEDLIVADSFAKRRYIQLDGKLNILPTSFKSFISSSILTNKEKFLLIKGFFNKKVSSDQSISDYVSTRFSPGVAQKFADPFIRGIFGGDIKKLHMGQAFPKMKKGIMTSFKDGMGQIFDKFEDRYGAFIKKNSTITSLKDVDADLVICTVPAYKASRITDNDSLNEIRYCTVSVVGLGFDMSSFVNKPDGFGYLIPSNQHKDILGVLTESNVYSNRAPRGCLMMRVMIAEEGNDAQLIEKSLKELNSTYGLKAKPKVALVQVWPKAIPQYEMNYSSILKYVKLKNENLIITGNYIKGISFNDCINNSKDIANSLQTN